MTPQNFDDLPLRPKVKLVPSYTVRFFDLPYTQPPKIFAPSARPYIHPLRTLYTADPIYTHFFRFTLYTIPRMYTVYIYTRISLEDPDIIDTKPRARQCPKSIQDSSVFAPPSDGQYSSCFLTYCTKIQNKIM